MLHILMQATKPPESSPYKPTTNISLNLLKYWRLQADFTSHIVHCPAS
jgi:hypothetical protein